MPHLQGNVATTHICASTVANVLLGGAEREVIGRQDAHYRQGQLRFSRKQPFGAAYIFKDTFRETLMDARKLAELSVFYGACQKMRELTPFISFVKKRQLFTIVEIGTQKGGTLWLWCQLADPSALIISIDLPRGEFGGGYKRRDMKRLRSYARAEQSLVLMRKDSHCGKTVEHCANLIRGERAVDLLFLDGDHRYDGVRRDFEMYAPFVRTQGIVLFHDILPHPRVPKCEVSRLWNEVKVHFRHKEFVHEADDRGWGQWGGLGALFYSGDGYRKALQEGHTRDIMPQRL